MTASFQELTFSELVEQALQERLIDACTLRRSGVLLIRGEDRFHMTREQGRSFLLGLLLGAYAMPLLEAAAGAPDEPFGRAGERPAPAARAPRQPRLDDLTASAKKLGIINDAVKDPAEKRITLILPDTRVRMSYAEAAEYLYECILVQLGIGGEEPTPCL